MGRVGRGKRGLEGVWGRGFISSTAGRRFVERLLAGKDIALTFASVKQQQKQNIMRMKIILSALFVMAATVASPQTTIKGTVVDSLTHDGEPHVTIRVYKKASEEHPTAMFATDLDGRFSHAVKGNGDYLISFRSMGRRPIVRTIRLSKATPTLNLDTLLIQDDAHLLKNVEIVAQKPLVKMETDKMSYDVQADVDAKTNTVLDMLRKVPMVTVDGQDNISVNGSSSFKVYVDGRPNVMFSSNPSQIFKAMPATMVKSIEVVTNPGAKYDAEGAGGVLNIVMNKATADAAQMNGYNGSLSAEVGNRSDRVSAFLSGQQGKLTFSANAMHNYGRADGTEVSMSREDKDGSTMSYAQKGDSKVPFSMANASLGLDLDTLSNLSATLGFTNFTLKNDGHPTTSFSGGRYGTGFSYSNEMKMKNRNAGFNGSLGYQRFLNAAHTHNIALTYMLAVTPGTTQTTTIYDPINAGWAGQGLIHFNDLYSNADTRATEHTLLADYTTPLGKLMTLNAGAKYINRANHSDSKYYNIVEGSEQYNPDNSVDYKNDQNILAGYAECGLNLIVFSAKAGLRYEHTWENVKYLVGRGSNFHRNYGNLVPTASVTYNIQPTMNIGVNYNMRITRPGISYLNPYVDRSNPTALTYGNSDLDVQKTHNVSLVFNTFSQKLMLNATLTQSFTGNEMAQYSFLDEDGLLNTTYGNIVKSRRTAVNVFANYAVTPATRLMLNGSVNYADFRSDALHQRNNGWAANGFLGLQQTLPWELKGSVFLMASTKSYTLQGYNGGMNIVNISLAKSFCHDKFNIAARFMTPLTGKLKMNMYSRGADFVQKTAIKVPLMNAAVTFTWNFGNTKRNFRKAQQQRDNDFEERQSREQQIMQMGSGNPMRM